MVNFSRLYCITIGIVFTTYYVYILLVIQGAKHTSRATQVRGGGCTSAPYINNRHTDRKLCPPVLHSRRRSLLWIVDEQHTVRQDHWQPQHRRQIRPHGLSWRVDTGTATEARQATAGEHQGMGSALAKPSQPCCSAFSGAHRSGVIASA